MEEQLVIKKRKNEKYIDYKSFHSSEVLKSVTEIFILKQMISIAYVRVLQTDPRSSTGFVWKYIGLHYLITC